MLRVFVQGVFSFLHLGHSLLSSYFDFLCLYLWVRWNISFLILKKWSCVEVALCRLCQLVLAGWLKLARVHAVLLARKNKFQAGQPGVHAYAVTPGCSGCTWAEEIGDGQSDVCALPCPSDPAAQCACSFPCCLISCQIRVWVRQPCVCMQQCPTRSALSLYGQSCVCIQPSRCVQQRLLYLLDQWSSGVALCAVAMVPFCYCWS